MTVFDYSIVIGFLFVMAMTGLMISRLIKTSDDFFVAGRELTTFVLCATITATNLSMFAFIGIGGTVYQSGVSIIWQNWTGAMALVLAGILVVPLMRRLSIRSIPEFLEMRYTRGLRTLVGAFWGIRLCVFLGILLYIASTAAIIITGCADTMTNYVRWLAAFSVVSILYSAVGGAWAVAIMDSVQFVVMLAGALIVLPIVMHAAGGMSEIIQNLRATGRANHLVLVPSTGEFNWLFIIAILLLGFKWATIDQAILQRAFGAKSPRISAKGMVLSGIITVPIAFFWVLPGLAASRLHPGLHRADDAIPYLLATQIPPVGRGLLGIVLCGLIAAQISAITADVNSVATLFTSDVYRSLLRKAPSQRQLLIVVRISSVVCGTLMLLVACFLRKTGASAVEANLAVVGILDMPLFVVTVLYGLLWKRANWQGATAGFLIGGLCGILTYHWIGPHSTEVRSIVPFVSAGAALIITPVVSLLTGKGPRQRMWDTLEANAEEEEAFHIIPRTFTGRLALAIVIAGVSIFCGGIVSAHWNSAESSWLA
ncbi:MAG TPA: sodium:solute symporter family protein, partial [Tepidisphaeraceae bacterium]|nr:sodium:solute symporter family protein [Tepidisphaeraceae bacterium]